MSSRYLAHLSLGLTAGLSGIFVLAPVWNQEPEPPLLSSEHAPAPRPREFPPVGPRPPEVDALFAEPGRNLGSSAHPFSPGRVRQDAPAWFELEHRDPPMPEWAAQTLRPRQPDPIPPLDPRFHEVVRLSDDFRSDDFPAVASSPGDRAEVWMAWVSYSGRRDEIRLARRDPSTGRWGPWSPVPGVTGDVWRPALEFDGKQRLWVVWSQQELFDASFDLYARWFDGERWGRLERLTSAPEGDFDHRLARDSSGRLHLVWQGFRGGQSDVFYLRYDGDRWSRELRLSPSEANDWAPSVAVDSQGAAQVVWDTYDRGDYDVVGRVVRSGSPEALTTIAATDFFEARPSIVVDGEDRVWVAYEVGEQGWGKDQGLLVDRERQPGSELNLERQVQVRVIEGGRTTAAKPELAELFPRRNKLHYTSTPNPGLSNPHLAIDDRGRVHLLLRVLESSGAYAQYWQVYTTTMTSAGWDAPALVPLSIGRLSMNVATAPGAAGALWLAWPRDNFPTFSAHMTLPEETVIENVYAGRWEPSSEPGRRTGPPQAPPFPARPPGHTDERGDVARVRAWRARVGGETLQILRGDTHRHTELSMDLRGVPDGSILDFYRYMHDAAAMDFGLISDHQYGADREYWWWLEEKLADLLHAPERYVAMFGYERSVQYPMGHRNVVHAQRGTQPLPFFEKASYREFPNIRYHNGVPEVQEDDTRLLFEAVRASGGVTIPHTSATSMGTDWRDYDREVETLVEIFQGDRHSYEAPGAPLTDLQVSGQRELRGPDPAGRAPDAARQQQQQQYAAGFVSNALAKGHRVGFIASSDHLSTHISYAMLWTTGRSREAVLEAMRKRRAYAATDNIVLELWIGDRFMGDEVALSEGVEPEILVRASGTRPFSSVEIVRNSRSIHRTSPGEREVEIRYRDLEPEPGESYYYARVMQEDGQMAWSSPIWVRRD